MKEIVEKTLWKYNLDEDEGRNAIEFVSELLDVYADETEKNEPSAYNTIARCREMASYLYGLELDEI